MRKFRRLALKRCALHTCTVLSNIEPNISAILGVLVAKTFDRIHGSFRDLELPIHIRWFGIYGVHKSITDRSLTFTMSIRTTKAL